MTLALYGKSNRRRLLLVALALIAVVGAMAGGAVLRESGNAKAATSTLAPSAASCANSSNTDDSPLACSANATTLANADSQKAVVEMDNSGGGTGYDDITVSFAIPAGTVSAATLHVTSALDPSDVGAKVRVGSSSGSTSYGTTKVPGTDVTYSNGTLVAAVDAANGSTFTAHLSVTCTPDASNDCGIDLDKVDLAVTYVLFPQISKAPTAGNNPVAGFAYWDITITNPGDTTQAVVVSDPGASFQGKQSGTGTCSTPIDTYDSFQCGGITANHSMVVRVKKPTNSPDFGANACTDGVIHNTATMRLQGETATIGTAVGTDITVPGSGAANCRDVTITKIRSGGGPSATFSGTLSAGAATTWTIPTTSDSPNQSTTVKVPKNTTVTVTEATAGAGWTNAGFTRVTAGGTCPASFAGTNQPSILSDTAILCVYNSYTVPQGPNLVVSKTDNVSHATTAGTDFAWTTTVTNTGVGGSTTARARFANNEVILVDTLPSTLNYSSTVGIGGTMTDLSDVACSISAKVLTCKATASNTDLYSGETLEATVTVTNPAQGDYTNPSGVCKADPNGAIETETSTTDNDCPSDQVIVSSPERPYVIFMKAICSSYKWVPANDLAPNIDDTGGHADELDVLAGAGDTNPSQIDLAHCTVASGWTFRLYQGDPGRDPGAGAGFTTIGPTDGTGQYKLYVDQTLGGVDLLNEITNTSDGLWVKETTQAAYGFGALRCYTDHLNGDNDEYITATADDLKAGKVYCIAFNVGPRNLSIKKDVIGATDNTAFPVKVDGSATSFNIAENNPRHTEIDFTGHTVQEVTASMPSGYAFDHWNLYSGDDVACSTASPDATGSASSLVTIPSGSTPVTVCFYNSLNTDLTVTKTHDKADVTLGQAGGLSKFTWTLTVNASGGTATFANGQAILTDTLPASSTYAPANPTATVAGAGSSGNVTCSIASTLLTCTANGTVTLAAGGTITIPVTVTPTVAGGLVNASATCRVNPDGAVPESDTTNNTCTDTVHVHNPAAPVIHKVAASTQIVGHEARWVITITNTDPYAIDRTVTVTDANTSFVSSPADGTGSSCSPANTAGGFDDSPYTCTLNKGGTITLNVATNISSVDNQCNGTTVHNQATLTGSGLSSQPSENPGIDVPGVPGQCDRVVTICKQITQNNDGVADNLPSLTFSVAGNTKDGTNSVALGAIAEGGSAVCGTITVLQKDTLTITEPDLGAAWTLSDITGASTKNTTTRVATVAAGPTSPTVTYVNIHTFQTKTIHVCKAFEANTDGIADTFTFVAHVVETGTNVVHGPQDATFTNVAEGQSPCQDVTVAQGATVTVTEPNLPVGWSGNFDGTYPKIDAGHKPDSTVDGSYWTVRNKAANKTRAINLCKLLNFVDDGVDTSGTFTFNLTWDGGSTSTTRDVTETAAPTSVCANVSDLPQGKDITITEADSRPGNWDGDEANFPTNNAAGGNGHKVGVVTHGADTPTVTFTNQPTFQTRNIYVCKNVLANADGTDDGGAFGFSVSWATLPSGTHTDNISRSAFETNGYLGHVNTDCGGLAGAKLAIAVPKGKAVTVAEDSSRPATWVTTSDDAAGFPKAKHGTDANYTSDASLTSAANSSEDEIDFQNSHAFRSRSIEICKAVDATDDGIESGGDFVFGITWSTGSADDLALNVLEGGKKCATISGLPAGYEITVAEKSKPAGWADFDATYPKFAIGASPSATGSSAVVTAAASSETVTFTNKPVFQTRDLFVCKNVVNNADGLDDGGEFDFSLTWAGGSTTAIRHAFEHTSASPSHVITDCGGDAGVPLAIKVPKGKDVTVTETTFAWGANNASGFPKTGLGNPPGSLSGPGTSIVSTANSVADTAYFQNKRADQTRTLTICKVVDHNLDGVNDGGAFGFSVKDSADQVVGGSQTRTAWEEAGADKSTSDCGAPITVLQGKSYTVTETSEPAGWQDDASLGYPKNDAAATSTFVTGAAGTVPSGNGNVTVTFKNRTLDRHMNVSVCKFVVPNNDNVDDGGDFPFKLTQAGATDQTFTVSNTEANAGGTEDGICATRSILQGVPWTISELAGRPGDPTLAGSWNGDAAAYPAITGEGPGPEAGIQLSGTTNHVTFLNKTDNRTHVLNVCKTVEDNNDGDLGDGGTFHFAVNGGGSPNPSSFDLTVAEGQRLCQQVTVLDGFTQTVTETEPQGWIDAKDYPQWAVLDSNKESLDKGSGTTSGTAGSDAATIEFTNRARPTQTVTFIKALCTAFEQIPSNNAIDGGYGQNDLPTGYTEKDLGAESPGAGAPVGATLPAGCSSVAGWTFDLFTFGNAPLGSVTTDAAGKNVELDNPQMDALVNGGGINVREKTQAGYSFGALKCYTDHAYLDNSENIVLPDAASTATSGVNCVAYNVATGSISGTKWDDLNGDGNADAGEPGLSGWTITATRTGGAPEFTTTTGAEGTYSFTGLPQGTYNVCETLQDGWTNTAPLCVEVTVGGGNDATNVDFLNFEDAHIYNVKVVTNDAADTTDFTADVTGPETFTSGAFHQGSPASDVVTHAGDYSSQENTVAGFQYAGSAVGQFGDGEARCPAQAPKDISTAGATATVTSGARIVFCHYNVEVGTVLLIKNETHQSAASEAWNFTSAILGNPALITPANGQNPPSVSTAQTTIENVPVGSYTIAETQGHGVCVAGSSSTDYQTNALAAVDATPNPDPAANVVGAGSVSFSVQKGKQTTIVFENQGCGTVLATSSLAVKKFADPAADFTGNSPLQGWEFTVSGTTTLGAPILRTQSTNGAGVAFFADLPDGTYTVTETLQGGWQAVGSKFVVPAGATLAGVSRDFTIGLEENKEIDFFNQPLGTIVATKLEVSAAGTHGGEGWLITISGCGHTETQPTGADGTATFSNLLPCAYTVSEKVDSKPGFAPVGNTSVSRTVAPGQTVRVGFENVKLEGCANCNTVSTPTPTPTTAPPTATPTQPAPPTAKPSYPTPTPTVVDITRGEKTPGPGLTPIAPSTGSGLFGSDGGSTNVALALLGIVALGAGLLVLTASRRRKAR